MRLIGSVAAQPEVRRWRRKRAAIVAICWLSGLALLYATLLLVIAAPPRYVYLCLVPSVAFFIAARRVRIGRRPTILYLRRFHSRDQRLRRAIAWTLDRRYRVVTLDDGMMAPARMPMADVIGALLRGALWGALGGLTVGLSQFGFSTSEPAELQVWNVLVTLVAIVPGLALGLCIGLVRVIAVQWRTRLRISAQEDLTRLEAALRRLRGGGMAPSYLVPRLVVVSTTDTYWRDAVTLAAAMTACPVIDVSGPSANLLWEVDQMLSNREGPVVFTANGDAIRQWRDQAAAGGSAEAAALAQRLEKQDVLVYEGEGVRGTWNLGRSLTAAFDNALLAPVTSSRDR